MKRWAYNPSTEVKQELLGYITTPYKDYFSGSDSCPVCQTCVPKLNPLNWQDSFCSWLSLVLRILCRQFTSLSLDRCPTVKHAVHQESHHSCFLLAFSCCQLLWIMSFPQKANKSQEIKQALSDKYMSAAGPFSSTISVACVLCVLGWVFVGWFLIQPLPSARISDVSCLEESQQENIGTRTSHSQILMSSTRVRTQQNTVLDE